MLNLPRLDLPLPFIKLLFENHSIIINTDTDELFTDGDKLDLSVGKAYEPDYCRPANTKNWQKQRVKTMHTNNNVIVINIGWDKRIFILYFTKIRYNTFRGKPVKQYSYWNNGSQKAFYEDDLSNPVWTTGVCKAHNRNFEGRELNPDYEKDIILSPIPRSSAAVGFSHSEMQPQTRSHEIPHSSAVGSFIILI